MTIEVKQKCPQCNCLKIMTQDHIVPEWFVKRIDLFEVDLEIVGNRQPLCIDCNIIKSGKINYKDDRVRGFMKEFVRQLQSKVA